MSEPPLSKKLLNHFYEMNILDPNQDPMTQFQEMQDLQRLYDSGKAPMESTTDPDLKKSRANAIPSSSTHSKQSSQDPVQTVFTDRARRLKTEQKEKEATEKAQRKAEARARKEATSRQQGAAMSKHAKYAAEEKERLKEEKMAKERVLKQIEVDKVERREREELRKEAVRAGSDSHGSRTSKPQVLSQSSRHRSSGTETIRSRRPDQSKAVRAGSDSHGSRTSKPRVPQQSSRHRSSGTETIRSRRPDQSKMLVHRAPSPPSSSRSRPANSANRDLDQDSTNGDYDEPSTSEAYVPHGGNNDSGGRSRRQISLPSNTALSRSGNHNLGRPTGDYDDPEQSRYCMACMGAHRGLKKALYTGNGQWRCEGPCGGRGAMERAAGRSGPRWDWTDPEMRARVNRRRRLDFLTGGEADSARSRSPSSVARGGSFSGSEGTRLGGPGGPLASPYGQLPSSPTTGLVHSPRSTRSKSPRAGTSGSSRPSPHRRTNARRYDRVHALRR